jgi:hypothetical protein
VGSLTIKIEQDHGYTDSLLLDAQIFFENHLGNFLKTVLQGQSQQEEVTNKDSSESQLVTSSTITQCNQSADILNVLCPQGKVDTSKPQVSQTRRASRKRKLFSTGPLYTCPVCNKICEDKAVITSSSEFSVGCDACFNWYHWGCVSFDDKQVETKWTCKPCQNV